MKSKNVLLIIVGLLLVVGLFVGFGNMSIIIGEEGEASCRINTTTNECTFNLTLPRFREIDSSYNLHLSFEEVPGELQSKTILEPINTQGPYRDERVSRDGVLYRLNIYDYYLYRLPSDWDLNNIHSIYVKSDVDGTFRRTITARVSHRIDFGFVNLNNTQNSLSVCTNYVEGCVIEYYRYRDDRYGYQEWRYSDSHLTLFSNIHPVFRSTAEHELRTTIPFTSEYENYILMEDIKVDNPLLFLRLRKELWGDRTTGNIPTMNTGTPSFEVAYAKSVRPIDLEILVGGEVVQTISGVMIDDVITTDVSDYINDYCDVATCVVPITFRSATDGVINMRVDSGVLKAQPYEVQTNYANVLEESNIVHTLFYVFSIIIVIILLIISYFKFWRKRK